MPDDIVEIDHIIPTSQGGKDVYDNLQLLHRHCHDDKTRLDGSYSNNNVDSKIKSFDNIDYQWINDMLVTAPMSKEA